MNKPIFTILAGLLLLFPFSKSHAQNDSILAKVGPTTINASQFVERYELMPQLNRGANDSIAKKYNFLHSLIAEKLLALEAENEHLDTAVIMRTTVKGLENMYVRDALYKKVIQSKVHVTNQQMRNGIKRIYTELKLNTLFERDSINIFKDFSLLKKGISFDSLVNKSAQATPDMQVKYGDLFEPIEDSVYALKVGQVSYPIKTAEGWLILRLAQEIPLPDNSKTATDTFEKVKQIEEDRQKDEIYDKFYKSFFPGRKITANTELFWSIAQKISSELTAKKKEESIGDSGIAYMNSDDMEKIEGEFDKDTLNMNFINFEKNPLTVQQFLRYFILEGFYTVPVDEKTIAEKLNSRVKDLIKKELLSREGYHRGLENQKDVKSAIQMWRGNYLSKILENKLRDSIKVTDEDVYKYYLSKSKLEQESATEVNILEILTDSLDVVDTVLNKLNHGADFRALARIHTKRIWTKKNGGEFGFFPSDLYGDIGRIAATMKIGEVYGPLKVPQGYSIFKLIGKRTKSNELPQKFEDVKGKLKEELYNKEWNKFLTNFVVKLADKYGVKIYDDNVRSTKVQDLEMVAFKYIGFGGRILAVPMTKPFTEWVKPWEESLKQLP